MAFEMEKANKNSLNLKLEKYFDKKVTSNFLATKIQKKVTQTPNQTKPTSPPKKRKIEQVHILRSWSKKMDTTGITYNKVDLTTCINMRLAVLLAKNL